ncbi:MAG: TolC family protein [Planctomycetota bacterium]|nr:TolC family protein [Planctomycetota bacterium]
MRRVHLVVPLAACALLALGGCTGRPAAQDDRDGSLARTSPLLAESVNDARRLVREETASREAAPAVLPVSAGDGSANAAKAAAVEQAELKAQGDKEKEAPASPPQLAEKTSLEAVLRLAAKGPMVQAARHRWLAATHKRPQMVALPDPRVEATYYVVRGMDRYMFGLSQEFPYPGKLIIAGRMADKEAEAARLRYDAALRDALSDAKEAYFELYGSVLRALLH